MKKAGALLLRLPPLRFCLTSFYAQELVYEFVRGNTHLGSERVYDGFLTGWKGDWNNRINELCDLVTVIGQWDGCGIVKATMSFKMARSAQGYSVVYFASQLGERQSGCSLACAI